MSLSELNCKDQSVAACKEGISPSCHAFEFKGLLPHAILATPFFRYMYMKKV